MASALSGNANRLRDIKTFPSLVKYLRDDLDWPIDSDDFEDLTFEWEPEELGIDPASAAKIQEIKQLRPLSSDQPWGIFFVKFEPRRLPVVALRRILRALVVRKRVATAKAQQKTWSLHDLLFISSYGESDQREIAFAHFAEEPELGDLATLRVLGWDEDNAEERLQYTDAVLREKLRWPDDDRDLDSWRSRWSEAFTLRPGEVIRTAKAMAERLAELAVRIRKRVIEVLNYERERGQMRNLYVAFKEALIHDLTEDDFADTYAQTICYGLLTARFSRPAGLIAENLKDMVPPSTNPFLRELLGTFLKIGGRKDKLDFDELGITEVLQTLHAAKMEEVRRDFLERNPDEDPTIRFYEDFLKQYDPKRRTQRGVFYTPRPVVSYIVRSVHELLQSEFGLPEGLASTTTWGEMVKRHPSLKIPEGTAPSSPFVQILDPAVGTGTFLVEVIDIVHKTMLAKWERDGRKALEIPKLWNEYVSRHLLPRLHGYELMMAPYAIAHMKIGLKLHETGYRFGSDERARIYLTNSLEPPHDFSDRLAFDAPALAHEAKAVNAIKREQRFTVVIGNPPYSASISEPDWLMKALEQWKQGLNETKIDLNREEWKFLRLGQILCGKASLGLLGFVINRDYLDGVAKRKMRESLQESFPYRLIVDLNGDVKGNIADQNVFEITQGVCITILCRGDGDQHRFFSVIGNRDEKYSILSDKVALDRHLISFTPTPPYFRWIPPAGQRSADAENEYLQWYPVNELFQVYSSGIQTKRDGLCIHFSEKDLWSTVTRLNELTVAAARKEFDLPPDGRDWTVAAAKADISASGPNKRYITRLLYRPFDIRFTYWTGRTKGFAAYPRREVMQHVVGRHNIGMIFNRQVVGDGVSHFGVSRLPICHGTFYLGNKGQDYFAPLFIVRDDLISRSNPLLEPNFSTQFASALADVWRRTADKPAPSDVFNYAYAVFHSPIYRRRYEEFLKRDFPRLPLTGDAKLFQILARLGGELVALHLMESALLNRHLSDFLGRRRPEVERVSYDNKTIWIDKEQVCGFQGVPEVVWEFRVGGYRVCEKWLKDRKGRVLSTEDIDHYQRIVVALSETIRLMKEIDKVIEKHGGWPGAFSTDNVDSTRSANA